MNVLTIRSFEEHRRDAEVPLRAMLEALVQDPEALEIAPDPRVFGRRCAPLGLGRALLGLQALEGLRVGAILALEPRHWEGVPSALMQDLLGGRPEPGVRGAVAELLVPGRGPAFLGVLWRDQQLWALFNALTLWRRLRA